MKNYRFKILKSSLSEHSDSPWYISIRNSSGNPFINTCLTHRFTDVADAMKFCDDFSAGKYDPSAEKAASKVAFAQWIVQFEEDTQCSCEEFLAEVQRLGIPPCKLPALFAAYDTLMAETKGWARDIIRNPDTIANYFFSHVNEKAILTSFILPVEGFQGGSP